MDDLTTVVANSFLVQIPLAEKLRECEVFGVAYDEFLNFATENRNEWVSKGQAIVTEMVKANGDKKRNGRT